MKTRVCPNLTPHGPHTWIEGQDGGRSKRRQCPGWGALLSTVVTRGEAEVAIEPKRANYCERVYACIEQFGPVTDEQIAELTFLNPSTARPRRLELERDGRIEQAGHGVTRSGRRAITWRVST